MLVTKNGPGAFAALQGLDQDEVTVMDSRSISRSTDLEYLRAVSGALQAILAQQQVRTEPQPQTIHEYRGTGHGAPRYRVADNGADLGGDWWPVALVTTTGAVISPSRAAVEDPETADMFAGFAAAVQRAEGGAQR